MYALDQKALARQAAALLLALKGTICIYQGEELGLPQADINFEELTDPPGIRFWPEYKGRDGERTPIPWDDSDSPNGFSTGKPWLPVKYAHSILNVETQNGDPDSTLNFYRSIVAFRKAHPSLVDGDIEFLKVGEPLLAFRRANADERLLCLYNLSANPIRVTFNGEGESGNFSGRRAKPLTPYPRPQWLRALSGAAGQPVRGHLQGPQPKSQAAGKIGRGRGSPAPLSRSAQ